MNLNLDLVTDLRDRPSVKHKKEAKISTRNLKPNHIFDNSKSCKDRSTKNAKEEEKAEQPF